MEIQAVPKDLIKRIPLFQQEWLTMIRKMRENPHSPRWNIEIGDRITADDLLFIQRFDRQLHTERVPFGAYPQPSILEWIQGMARRSIYFLNAIRGLNLAADFYRIPRMTRKHVQTQLHAIIPHDQDLSRLIVNPTSGTTGEPIKAPNHPQAIGCYDPMIQYCLQQHGVQLSYDCKCMAAMQFCFQKNTIIYNTVHSYLNGAGFAKVNLALHTWPNAESPAKYIDAMQPYFFSGDPIAYEELLKFSFMWKPKALLSTALSLDKNLRQKLQEKYACPVIDFYSLNETGPLAYSCPNDPLYLTVIAPDLFIEITDAHGNPVPDGEEGEITVTGGRNPFLPLLRYATGDRGIMERSRTNRQDPMPRLRLTSGRKSVLFYNTLGERINPIDLGRILRSFPVVRHQCIQHKDFSLTLRLEKSAAYDFFPKLYSQIQDLFGNSVLLTIEPIDKNESLTEPYIQEIV